MIIRNVHVVNPFAVTNVTADGLQGYVLQCLDRVPPGQAELNTVIRAKF